MYKNLFKFAVTTITILTVNLITSIITSYLISYKVHYKPITFTLIAMGTTTIVFYPLFIWLKGWINSLSIKIVRSGKSMGGKYLGLLFVFMLCIAILLYFYAKMWYNIDLLKILIKGRIGSMM